MRRASAVWDAIIVLTCALCAQFLIGYALFTAPLLLSVYLFASEVSSAGTDAAAANATTPTSSPAAPAFLLWRVRLLEASLRIVRLRRMKVVRLAAEGLTHAGRWAAESSGGLGTALPRLRSGIRKSLL